MIEKINKTKNIKQLNDLESEIVEKYGLLYTTNNFLIRIEQQRTLLYSQC